MLEYFHDLAETLTPLTRAIRSLCYILICLYWLLSAGHSFLGKSNEETFVRLSLALFFMSFFFYTLYRLPTVAAFFLTPMTVVLLVALIIYMRRRGLRISREK